jgi:hypothetical protein
MRRLAAFLLLLTLAVNACEKKNPNYDPAPPYDGRPVGHHKFDGGNTDPYGKAAEGGEGGGEAKGAEGK